MWRLRRKMSARLCGDLDRDQGDALIKVCATSAESGPTSAKCWATPWRVPPRTPTQQCAVWTARGKTRDTYENTHMTETSASFFHFCRFCFRFPPCSFRVAWQSEGETCFRARAPKTRKGRKQMRARETHAGENGRNGKRRPENNCEFPADSLFRFCFVICSGIFSRRSQYVGVRCGLIHGLPSLEFPRRCPPEVPNAGDAGDEDPVRALAAGWGSAAARLEYSAGNASLRPFSEKQRSQVVLCGAGMR